MHIDACKAMADRILREHLPSFVVKRAEHFDKLKLRDAIATAIFSSVCEVAADAYSQRQCVCEHGDPCHPRCPCAHPHSSSPCRWCARHGSREQQRERAQALVKVLRAGEAALSVPKPDA